jgi:hypothetical protein
LAVLGDLAAAGAVLASSHDVERQQAISEPWVDPFGLRHLARVEHDVGAKIAARCAFFSITD